MFLPLLLNKLLFRLVEVCSVLVLDVLCPLVQILLFFLPEGASKVVDALAFQLALADFLLPVALHLRLAGLHDLNWVELRQIFGDDLLNLLALDLEVRRFRQIRLFLHLLQHFLVLDHLLLPLALLLALTLALLALDLLPGPFRLGLALLLLPLTRLGLALQHVLATLALLLPTLDLLLALADEPRLFLDALDDVGGELLLFDFLLRVLLLGGDALHRLLKLQADFDQRLLHALHVHLAGSAEDDRLVAVIDLDVDAVLPCGVRHPLLGDAEGHDGGGVLEVVDGHVGIHLRQLLHQAEEDDLLQRRDVWHQLAIE
mmetsp:Transcript_89385/g.257816  ORF Transcript_89385/g.257816 Transcript_89385/m.257816 type:complete len:316 (-) Transcript_89385:1466-2413(-)